MSGGARLEGGGVSMRAVPGGVPADIRPDGLHGRPVQCHLELPELHQQQLLLALQRWLRLLDLRLQAD